MGKVAYDEEDWDVGYAIVDSPENQGDAPLRVSINQALEFGLEHYIECYLRGQKSKLDVTEITHQMVRSILPDRVQVQRYERDKIDEPELIREVLENVFEFLDTNFHSDLVDETVSEALMPRPH